MFRVLIALWWIAVVLSTAMVATLAALLMAAVLARRRPLARRRRAVGAVPGRDRPPEAASRPGWTARARFRRMLLAVWAATFATWIALEALGGAFLLRDARSSLAPLPADLPASPPGTFSIVAVGESTALGAPYQSRLSFAHIVGWRLAAAFPDLRIFVQNLAFGGAVLEEMHERLEQLETRPDLLLVYAGHNEFLRFPPDREAGRPYYGVRHFSLLARAIAAQLERLGAHEGPTWRGRRRLFDRPICTAHEAAEIHRRFRTTLADILRFMQASGRPAIVFLPASNESGFEPNRSILPDDTPAETRARLGAVYARLALPGLRARTELDLLREARRLAPGFAETWFRLGRWYEAAARTAKARRCYQRAIDTDGSPLRATSTIRRSIRAAAQRHGAILLDAREATVPFTANGILGNDVMHDNCHPNLPIHVALANMVLQSLSARGIPRAWPSPGLLPPEIAATVPATMARFDIDPAAWTEICEHEARFYEYLAAYSYRTEARGRRGAAYQAAADRIRSGVPPPAARIPAMESPAFW
jgi:tetratricopeptide (TPR) repeat protein